ncbi:MAG: hypothetical protein ABIB97_01725 [Patescibacteria group bacterium]
MKKSLIMGVLLVGGLALTGIGITQAMGYGFMGEMDPAEVVEKQEMMFQHQAETFGITEDQAKDYWVQGMHPKEIAEELGLSEEELQAKMQEMHQQRHQEKMQILVDNGVITQEQADQKTEAMKDFEPGAGCKGMEGKGGGTHRMW